MSIDWRVVIDDSGGPFSGWPSVCSDDQDGSALHRAGFVQEFWTGPSQKLAIEIAQLVAAHLNRADRKL